MTVSLGTRVPIPTAVGTRAFQFSNGDICVEAGDVNSAWSDTDGDSWTTAPSSGQAAPGPGCGAGESRAVYYASTNILSLARLPAAAGGWAARRSGDDWVTVSPETVTLPVDAPPYIPPGGGRVPLMIFNRGLIQLASGNLVAALYGSFSADTTPVQGWPSAFAAKKARLVLYQSTDNGVTWTNLVTLMNNLALGRAPDLPGPPPVTNPTPAAMPMVSQEGTTINDMVIAPNGTVLTFAQSGARISTQEAGAPPTPIYYTTSSATIGSSSTPLALSLSTDFTIAGGAPSAVKTTNNFIVLGLTYPTTRIYISSDNGATFGQETTLCTDLSGTPITLLPLTSGRVLAIYKDASLPGQPFIARQITVS